MGIRKALTVREFRGHRFASVYERDTIGGRTEANLFRQVLSVWLLHLARPLEKP